MSARRRHLRQRFDISESFSQLEESCIPSYCHGNVLAAYTAWWRLFAAASLAKRKRSLGSVLDFGSGAGELRHLLTDVTDYEFVEQDDHLANALMSELPTARRRSTDTLPGSRYSTVFALDSLEHNAEPDGVVARITASLKPGGLFVLSGPTENALYRLGRRIAGFSGHYHETDIHEIETVTSGHLTLVRRIQGPALLPLFSVSAWSKAL